MDLLDKEDRKVVQKYFVFSNVWIESTWLYSLAKEHLETENNLNFDMLVCLCVLFLLQQADN